MAGQGACINGSGLKMNIVKMADNSVRFVNETVKYANAKDCTGELSPSYKQPSEFSLATEIGAAQTVQSSSFNQAQWQLEIAGKLGSKQPVVFGFKNADQFCLVSTDQPNDIHAYLQQVDFSRVNTCYTRSAASYSQQKPQQVVATASYRFDDNQTAWTDVLNQLNDQGRQGYALITPSVALKNPEGSFSIYKNLYVKNNASQDTYTYTTADVSTNIVANRYLLWFDELKKQGALGYLYKLSFGETSNNTRKYLFVKNDQKPATYSYENRFLTSATRDNILAALNDMGAKGCKLIDAGSTYTNNGTSNGTFYVTTCVNSSTHHGTYSYRYVPLNGADVAARATILKEQAAEGYRLIDKDNKASFGLTASGYLFEKDSENTGAVEYKLYAEDAADSSESAYGVENRIQDQGKLGWFFATRLGMVYTNTPSNHDLSTGVVFPK